MKICYRDLVQEDENGFRKLVRAWLQARANEVKAEANGVEAHDRRDFIDWLISEKMRLEVQDADTTIEQ